MAIEVGYESSASFIKMFKRAYGLSPVKFREINKKSVPPISNEQSLYQIGNFDNHSLVSGKVNFNLNIEFNEFYDLICSTCKEMSLVNADFMILWDEDPLSSQSKSSRCFVAEEAEFMDSSIHQHPIIEGKYANFSIQGCETFDYQDWYRIAFHVLEAEQIEMRESIYIEHFSSQSLISLDSFYPFCISAAIE